MSATPDATAEAVAPKSPRWLWWTFAAVVAIALLLRVWNLRYGLPDLPAADEGTIVDRAVTILDGRLPDRYGWPTASDLLFAAVLRPLRAVGVALTAADILFVGRILFALVSTALVFVTGLLASSVADARDRRASVAVVAAALCAFGYTLLRLGRTVQPDELQGLFVVTSLLCAVRASRQPSRSWFAAAGLAAGAAAGTKYVGGVVLVVAVAAAWKRARTAELGITVGGAIAGFVLTVPAIVTKPSKVFDGLSDQFSHQAGHLGYDGKGIALGDDVLRFLPGTWGWIATLLAIGALVAVARRGTFEQRLVVTYCALALLLVGATSVRFPHYILPVAPTLAVLASIALHRALHALHPRLRASWIAPVVITTALVPTMLNDVRLLRAQASTDTRTAAAPVIAHLSTGHRVVQEWYTDPASSAVDTIVPVSIAAAGDLSTCDCFVVTSSYQEERYRREPARYASIIAAYDDVRAHGRVIEVIAPSRHLAYNWDTLPRFGLDDLPIIGDLGLVGPTITVYDLTRP